MPAPPTHSGIRDNHYCGSVGDYLKPNIRDGSQMSVVSAFFTIYAYAALKDWLDRIGHKDFLFGEPSFVKSLDPAKTETKAFIIAPEGLKLAKIFQQKRVARECADCTLFDQQTADGSNTALYDSLLKKAVESVVATFRKRVATGLQTGRSFKIPEQKDQASDTTDFELVTWLVIKKP